ncbi:MAG: hypothetical protein E7213_06735 [Clostridium sp.]|jgi:hypothetical protein|nr:hypothetical protein [Clostridium sp.]
MKKLSKITAFLLIFLMMFAVKAGAIVDKNTINIAIKDTVNEIMTRKPEPAFGDEWNIIALARSGENIPQSYYDTYYKSVEQKVLNESKKVVPFTPDFDKEDWTGVNDLERTIITLNAIGKDPQNVNGINLVNMIFNRENLADENGVSGLTYALISIDTKNYPEIPGAINTRDSIIKDMLALRTKDGGFSWDSNAAEADLDTTAMAIQALYKYIDRSEVKEAVDRGLEILKSKQSEEGDYIGHYMNYTYESPCTAAQVVVALDNLKMNPIDASNGFVKKKDLIDVMMSYYINRGGFKNSSDEISPNPIATQQILYSLDSYKRLLEGKNTLYDMTDVATKKAEQPVQTNNNSEKDRPEIKTSAVENGQQPTNSNSVDADANKNVNTEVNEVKKDDESAVVNTGDTLSYTICVIAIISGLIVFRSRLIRKEA